VANAVRLERMYPHVHLRRPQGQKSAMRRQSHGVKETKAVYVASRRQTGRAFGGSAGGWFGGGDKRTMKGAKFWLW